MNKKGQGGLSMNTIIVAIIAIIVLVLIVGFFTGSTASIFGKINTVFKGGTAGADLALSRSFCESYCQTAKLNKDAEESTYCQKTFDIVNNKDVLQKGEYCSGTLLGADCVVDGKLICANKPPKT